MTKRGGDSVVSVAHCSGPVWGYLPSHMPPPCPRTTPQSTSLSTNLYAKRPHHTVHVNLLKVQLTTQSVVAGGMNPISVGKHSQLHSIHIIKPSSFLPSISSLRFPSNLSLSLLLLPSPSLSCSPSPLSSSLSLPLCLPWLFSNASAVKSGTYSTHRIGVSLSVLNYMLSHTKCKNPNSSQPTPSKSAVSISKVSLAHRRTATDMLQGP